MYFRVCQWRYMNGIFMYHSNAIAAKILLFYLIFYAALAGFFAGLMTVFWQTLENDKPKYQLSDGIIGSNPGLGFRPMPPEANLGSTLVWYKASKTDNLQYWYDTVNKFLDGAYSACTYQKRTGTTVLIEMCTL